MARDPRSLIYGGTYHVMNRGNRKMPIFADDRDRRRFLRILIEEKERYGVDLLAGCQMQNHLHLVLVTPHANLSDFMEQLQGRFARYSNWRHQHVGHLFQGRFRDVVIESDLHLLTALCYVFLNPVAAGLVTRPEDYKWSSYAATAGFAPLPNYISIDWLSSLFDGGSVQDCQRRFRGLMSESHPVAAYLQDADLGVDPESVRQVLRSYVGGQLQLGRLPSIYRTALRSTLPELLHDGLTLPARAVAIYDAHVIHGYKLAEIARQLHLHQSAVSKIFRAHCKKQTTSVA